MLLMNVDLGDIHEKTHKGTTRVVLIIKIVFWKMTTCLYPNMVVLFNITNNNSTDRDSSNRAPNISMKSFFYDVVDS